jgi:hypothetical protein
MAVSVLDIMHDGRVSYVPINALYYPAEYQRPLKPGHIRKIEREFDAWAVGILLVSQRKDGKLYVIDGWHRVEVMKRLGIPRALCLIFDGLDNKREAQLFDRYNNAKKPAPLELFRARLEAEDEDTVALNQVILDMGYYVDVKNSESYGGKAIHAIRALEEIFRSHGERMVREVLGIISRIWGGTEDEHRAITGDFMRGLHVFIRTYEKEYDKARLIKRLTEEGFVNLNRRAGALKQAGGMVSRGVAVATAILYVYNYRLQSRKLPDKFVS